VRLGSDYAILLHLLFNGAMALYSTTS
jgi:hypothetical protein